MTKQLYQYHDGSEKLEGYLSVTKTQTSPKPGLLICPDWTGRNTFVEKQADALAELGYVGFAVDIYGQGRQGKDNAEKTALMQPFMKNRALLRQRLLAAFHALKNLDAVNVQQIAIIGFCFGGLCALDLARSGADIKAAVSFHGLLSPPDDASNQTIKAKVLVLHGYNDPMVPPPQVEAFAKEMTEAHVDWQIHMYGNTMHAFTNPSANDPRFGTIYNPIASERSFHAMHYFLQQCFQNT